MIKKIEKESCQVGIWQKYYTNGMTRDSIKNIGDDWKEIRRNGREKKRKD